MQAAALMGIYVLTTAALQIVGFFISRIIDFQWPTMGLMTFLVLFMAAFGFGWPLAVLITEWGIRSAGYVVETEQSGGASRQDHIRRRPG